MKSNFADRAKISQAGAGEITMATANGLTKAKLAKADKVTLGKLAATNVPVAIQNTDAKSYGAGVDGLLGMKLSVPVRGPDGERIDRGSHPPGKEIALNNPWNPLRN